MVIKNILIVVPLIIGTFSPNIAFAEPETIVHLERQRYSNPEKKSIINPMLKEIKRKQYPNLIRPKRKMMQNKI